MDVEFRKRFESAISWSALGVVFVSYRCLLFLIISCIFCVSVKLAVAIYIRWKIPVQY